MYNWQPSYSFVTCTICPEAQIFFIQQSYVNLFSLIVLFYFMHHMLMLLKVLSFPSIILMHVICESSLNHVLGHCAM